MRLALLGMLAVLLPSPAPAQDSTAFALTVPNIMRGPEVYGREPGNVRWSADSRWIYFEWLPPGSDWRERPRPFRVRAQAGSQPERLSDAHMDTAGPLVAARRYTRDRRQAVVEYEGDLYVLDVRGNTARRLTQTVAIERDPHFDAEERRVLFIRDGNVFSLALDGGFVRQLTDIRSGPAPADSQPPGGYRGTLAAQQRELFEVVRDQLARDSIQKAEREAREAARLTPLYLTKGERVTSLSVSPTGQALLLITTVDVSDTKPTVVPRWVTATGFTEDIRARTKVGEQQSGGRVAFVSLPGGAPRWLTAVPGDTARPPAMISSLGWSADGRAALLYTAARDWKARYLQTVSADSGTVRTIDTLTDSAWIQAPCLTCGGWLPDGRAWFVSEADGYAHLYTIAADGSDRRQRTSGEYEVLGAELSPDGREFWLHTSEVSPFEKHFYRMPVSGGSAQRVTQAKGAHQVTMSPNGQVMADVHSRSNRPPELFLTRLAANAQPAQLTTSPTAAWLSHDWISPEIIRIPASDGVGVPARIYRPADVGALPNGAGVIFVHGAGYLHNVHEWWSSYSREYMFNHLLASKGYVVLDIDYRGSAGYGRDWRTAVYRHMGGRDLQDHVDGARYLQAEFGIDPERIGIYGGSYGGFITLMALFTEPEWFGAGAALRSVTDWAHYNHWYTSRILNLPEADSTAYRQSSPIYFAEGLEDPLLIAHGMVDVNVHFQDVVRLVQRLIELGKVDWEMAVYPVEDHAFVRPSSWADEYRRILELFDEALVREAASATDGRP
ncbi:MAG TPA: prolyl oligopeptidase family serine peptidase [Gemmatimonadaceae bacterium]|nr:prolyl oligopeptidase family serine peptidase [Gemmatimonadaceae bacterium]